MDNTKPVNAMAYKAFLAGNFLTSVSAITLAPPLSDSNWPKITPNPIGSPILDIMLPKPSEICVIVPMTPNFDAIPIYKQAIIIAILGLIFKTIIKNKIIAIEMTRLIINKVPTSIKTPLVDDICRNSSLFEIYFLTHPGPNRFRLSADFYTCNFFIILCNCAVILLPASVST